MSGRGRFITLEGGEGAGKSTQVRSIAAALRRAGLDVVATREPGGAPSAEQIRALLVQGDTDRWDPTSEALLHFAARREHLVRTVRPALARGAWVVSDRFADSTMAYQGYGLGLGRAAVETLHELVVEDTTPDLTVILDLPVEQGLRRAASRAGDEHRYERMGAAFHESLRTAFLDIAAREPGRCAVVDAGGSIDATFAAIRAVIAGRLGIDLP